MGFFRSRIIDFCAIMAGVLTAAALHGFAWNLDVGLCVAYTVEVLGLALTDRRASVFSAAPSRPIAKILLLHLGFLAGVVLIARAGLFLMPVQLVREPHQSRPINWGLIVVVMALFALAYWEERLLFRKSKPKTVGSATGGGDFEPLAAPSASTQIAIDFAAQNGDAPAQAGVTPAAVATAVITPGEAVPNTGISGALTAADFADAAGEHEAFMIYLNGKDRAFRKPGVSVKQEYELWLAHRAKMQSKAAAKKRPA